MTLIQQRRSEVILPSIMCKDIGMDCPFEAKGTTNPELMRKFIDHAQSAHKMQVLPADIIFKVQHAIKK
jgi:predicted small metal-binding protein